MQTKTRSRSEESKRNAQHRRILDSIKSQNPKGLLTTDDVVSAARPEDHPLHLEFEWDDSIAAHEHRKAQANALIRRVYVIEMDTQVPAFLSLSPDRKNGGGYRPVSEILNNEQSMAQLAEDAKRDLAAWTERYKMLGGLVSRVAKAAGIGRPNRKAR